jgi:hypothetical protein
MSGIKQTTAITVKSDSGGTVVSQSKAYTAPTEENFNVTVPAGGHKEVDLAIDVSQIVQFYVASDKDVKLNTNALADVDADQTLNLVAKEALLWNGDLAGVNPLTTDITKLYLINDGDTDAVVKGGFLLDVAV